MIQEGVNGALFDSGNLKDLKEKIRYLWDAPGFAPDGRKTAGTSHMTPWGCTVTSYWNYIK